MAKLKISKCSPRGGCICAECKKHNSVNEGYTETYKNGKTHLWCAHCGKETILRYK